MKLKKKIACLLSLIMLTTLLSPAVYAEGIPEETTVVAEQEILDAEETVLSEAEDGSLTEVPEEEDSLQDESATDAEEIALTDVEDEADMTEAEGNNTAEDAEPEGDEIQAEDLLEEDVQTDENILREPEDDFAQEKHEDAAEQEIEVTPVEDEEEEHVEAAAASNPYGGGWSNCTWGAWQLAYERAGVALPGWGNAGTWLNSAKSAGYATGSTPKAKSIAVWRTINSPGAGSMGHVAYVTAVSGSTITIAEGGYQGGYHEGTAPASGYRYGASSAYDDYLLGYIYLDGAALPSAPSAPTVNASGSTVTVSWNDVSNETSYDVYLVQSPWGWEDIKYSKTGLAANTTSCTFTGVRDGDYSAFVIARPNADSVQSTWTAFTVKNYTITFNWNANGGSGTMASTKPTYNQAYTLPANKFTRTGYVFKGWNLRRDNDGKWFVSGVGWKTAAEAETLGKLRYPDQAKFNAIEASFVNGQSSSDVKFTWFAVWEQVQYAITFNWNANGGSGTMAATNPVYNQAYTLPANKFTRSGYVFKGWNLRRDNDSKWFVAYKGWKTASEAEALGKQLYKDKMTFNAIEASFITGQNDTNVKFTWFAVWEREPAQEEIAVQGITLNETSVKIPTRSSLQLKATITPSNATDQSVTWKSSETSVATVDKNGKVTAKTYGTATITATTANGKKATCRVQTLFYDVTNPKASCYNAVYWAVDWGITKCTVNFRPEDTVTRGEFAAFIWRMAGEPKAKSSAKSFTDVKSGAKFYDAIRWAAGAGIIKGYADGTFRPNDTVTRSQAITMLWRYAKKPAPWETKSPFSDIKKNNSDSYKAILWGKEQGIVHGSHGKFLPNNGCERQHIVIFLYLYDLNAE